MGRPSKTITISTLACKKCKTIKTTKQTPDGKQRIYYTPDANTPSNWKCEHDFGQQQTTIPNITKPKITKKQSSGITKQETKTTNQQDNNNRENAEYIPRKIEGKDDTEILQHYFENKTPLLIFGDTGTGKTHALRHITKKNNMRYARIPCNGSTTPDQLLGHFIPDKQGGFKWTDGIVTDFVRNGGVVVLDEVNGMNPESAFALHGLLDDEKIVVLVDNDGEIIKAHKDFWICATMNPDYEGTKTLNEAFASRFRKVYFDYSEEAEKKILDDKKLIEFAKKIRVMHRAGEIRTALGTRTLINYELDKKALGEKVALHVMLNVFDEDQRAFIKETFELIVDQKRKDNDSNLKTGA